MNKARFKVIKFVIVEFGITESNTRVKTGVLKIEKSVLLRKILFVLLSDMLSIYFLAYKILKSQ